MASAETVAGSTRCGQFVPSASARLGLQELEWSDVELMFVLMFLGAKESAGKAHLCEPAVCWVEPCKGPALCASQ